jgi:hypothetical protein
VTRRVRTAILSILLAALAGCAACDDVPDDALEDCEASQVVPGPVKTDILFVIDDSGSMSEEQATLQAGLTAFIQALASSPIANDFQIGVTKTSVADFDGTPRAPAGDLVGPVLVAGSPSLVADFQAQVIVGTGGSGREQPFEAARLALVKSEPGGPNAGFLRPGARLAIVFLSDEDDCSGPFIPNVSPTNDAGCRLGKTDPSLQLTPIASVASFLSGPIAGEVRDVVVAAIVGVAPGTLVPSCGLSQCADNTCSTAREEGTRFVELLAAFSPARTRLASICDANFDQALEDFAVAMMSQTLPLDGAVADYRMLVAAVTRPGFGTIGCTIQPADAPAAVRNAADAVYEEPQAGRPASLTFQNACALEQGDSVQVKVVCVR